MAAIPEHVIACSQSSAHGVVIMAAVVFVAVVVVVTRPRLTRGSLGLSPGSFEGATRPRLPMPTGSSGTQLLGGRRREPPGDGFYGLSLFLSPACLDVSMCLGTAFQLSLIMMLLCIWFGLYRVLSSSFDHYYKLVKFKTSDSSGQGFLTEIPFIPTRNAVRTSTETQQK